VRYVFFVLFAISVTFQPSQARADSLKKAGDILQFAIPVYAFGLAMCEENKDGVKQFAYGIISSQVTVHALKQVTQQKRPCFREGDKKNSFPSGHASSAFAGATFIHKRYGFRKAIIPYGAAILTGVSRVKAKKHHVRDVVAGALISGFWTMCFVDRLDKKEGVALTSDEDGTILAYEMHF
jgi:membrane-associated phospholipid phosphatase